MPMALVVLVVGITATGYADLGPTERLSGPALVGMLTLLQTGPDVQVSFTGKCRGNDSSIPSQTLENLSLAGMTTAQRLEGLLLLNARSASTCPGQNNHQSLPSNDLIVNTVVSPTFTPTFSIDGTIILITAEAVLLFVVPL
jgi:hypothetical protein